MGIVYILTNEAFDGMVKIGRTESDLEARMKSLDTTGVPLPFECFYAAEVTDSKEVERRLHKAFADKRVRGDNSTTKREFFWLEPGQAKAILELVAVSDATPKKEVLSEPSDSEALVKAHEESERRSNFTFDKAGVPIGATIVFERAPEHTATVVSNNKVLFRGDEKTLSSAALTVLHELGFEWKTVRGPSEWLYEDQTLAQRRQERESADDPL